MLYVHVLDVEVLPSHGEHAQIRFQDYFLFVEGLYPGNSPNLESFSVHNRNRMLVNPLQILVIHPGPPMARYVGAGQLIPFLGAGITTGATQDRDTPCSGLSLVGTPTTCLLARSRHPSCSLRTLTPFCICVYDIGEGVGTVRASTRLNIDLKDGRLQRELKMAAVERGLTIRDVVKEAIELWLAREAVLRGIEAAAQEVGLTDETLQRIDQVRKELSRRGRLVGDSADLIEEARRERTDAL